MRGESTLNIQYSPDGKKKYLKFLKRNLNINNKIKVIELHINH